MSRQSAKSNGRSTKPARAATAKTAKKTSKTASGASSRGPAGKKAPKSARRPAAKAVRSKTVRSKTGRSKIARSESVRAAPATVARAPSVAPETLARMIRTASPPMQPMVPDVPVAAHRFQVGEAVYYTSPTFGRAAATGSYTVIKLLPSEGDDYQYRIKSSGEAFERVAKESQLDKA